MSSSWRFLVVLTFVLASCGGPRWIDERVDGLQFSHPTEWQLQLPKGQPPFGLHSTPVLYLANFATHPECVEEPSGTFHCGQAIPALRDGYVVIAWWREIGRGAFLPDGPQIAIDGREARLLLQGGAAHYCDGADVEAQLVIGIQSGLVDDFHFCSRGVDRQLALAAFQRFVGSISFPNA